MKYVIAFIFPGISLMVNKRLFLGFLFLIAQTGIFIGGYFLRKNPEMMRMWPSVYNGLAP
ncbi:MAG: hypothetical protein JSS64_00690 [Bacteroidetes bacterium]|nr:hypothetical protein [Bacteroidota bacterium]